jgi:hypothetical protein
MRLAGQANWWAPAPLRRLHDRFGLSEGGARATLPVLPVLPVASQHRAVPERVGRQHNPKVDTLHWCSLPVCPDSDSDLVLLEGRQEV